MPPKRTYKLQKKLSSLKRDQPGLQNMKFLSFFSIFVGLDPDPDPDFESGSRYGSTVLIESGSGSETLLI